MGASAPRPDDGGPHESEFCQSDAVVVRGTHDVLLIDPGVFESELVCLATDLAGA